MILFVAPELYSAGVNNVNAGSVVYLGGSVFDIENLPRQRLVPDSIILELFSPTGVSVVSGFMTPTDILGKFVFPFQTDFDDLNGVYFYRVTAVALSQTFITAKAIGFKLFDGEDAQGGAIVPPDVGSGVTYGRSVFQVTSQDNTPALTITNGLATDRRILGVTYYCQTSFGTTRSLTTISIGTVDIYDMFGSGIGISTGTQTNIGDFRSADQIIIPANKDLILSADDGLFDLTGSALISVHWETLTPATSI